MKNRLEVLLPDVNNGSEQKDATVSLWCAGVGEALHTGDDLLEIITDKASFVVPCPCDGIVLEQRVREDDRVQPGDVLAVMEVES